MQEGVGDTPDSFAYDGHRVRKWNVMTGKYGEVQVSVLLKPEKLSAIFGTAKTAPKFKCLAHLSTFNMPFFSFSLLTPKLVEDNRNNCHFDLRKVAMKQVDNSKKDCYKTS